MLNLSAPLDRVRCQHMYRLILKPREDVSVKINYLLEEGNVGHYYVEVFDRIARCAEPRECVALLDALDVDAIERAYYARIESYALLRHLQNSRCNDAPRREYIQRRMAYIIAHELQ